MTKNEVKEFLIKRPGYLKEGSKRLADKLKCNAEVCKEALREARIELMEGFETSQLANINVNNIDPQDATDFDAFIKDNNISRKDIKSVKYWQNMGGESRFSVVVKSEDNLLTGLKDSIIQMLEEKSPVKSGRPKKCKKCGSI